MNNTPTVGRRSLLQAGIGAAAATALIGPATAAPARADSTEPRAEIIDLGVAMTSVNTRYATTGVLPDGTPVIHEISQGTPTTFNVINALDGSRLYSHTFNNATTASAITLSPDQGHVYFALRGGGEMSLHQYEVATSELTLLATNPAGQSMTRNIVATDTVLYCSTYPDAKVYSYDLATGAIRDYGPMAEGAYAWGLEVVDDQVWVGVGIGQGTLVVLDPASGSKVVRPLPAYAGSPTLIHMIVRRGDLVVCVFQPSVNSRNVAVWDLSTGEWTDDHPLDVIGLNGEMTPVTDDGVCYFMGYDGTAEIYAFDPVERTIASTGWGDTPMGQDRTGFQHIGLSNLGTVAAPRVAVTGMLLTGRHWHFDPETGDHHTVIADVAGSPIGVHTLDVGPGGHIYTGAHLSSGVMGMIDTHTDTVHEMIGPSQADAVTVFDGQLVIGTYPGAAVHVGHPQDAWDWGTNPAKLFSLDRYSEYQQDRPRDLIAAGDRVAMATVPTYGELGGAVTLFTLDGDLEVHRNIVPDHSVVSVAYQDELIVGGTSVDGGLSSTPKATDAEVFVLDPATGERSFHAVPHVGARSIGALCNGTSTVWGLTDTGVLFEVDPMGRTIVRTVSGAPASESTWGSSTFLQFRKQDGLFYGANGGRMFVFDPRTEQVRWNMDQKVGRLAINQRGQIYFSNGTHVYRYLPR